MSKITYQNGLNNTFSSEAEKGALPLNQNSPQKVPYNLYAEQLSGSAFTVPRHLNLRSWQYRIRPSVCHQGKFHLAEQGLLRSAPCNEVETPPDQMRWDPLPIPKKPTDFIQGLVTMATNGSVESMTGAAIHLYAANQSMTDHYFYNADGDLLILPQDGRLLLKTEFGLLEIEPNEVAVIQRGIRFQVELLDKHARGYICENYGAPFQLPERGPIGANGLAEERHFQTPNAWYEQHQGQLLLTAKFNGKLWRSEIKYSPLDVVAWHGSYAPYKYDLGLYQPIGSVKIDHPDPSIFTVLTSASGQTGTANIDFVIFPARWMVAENTFRPPWFHRNIMNEYMGLIHGEYDAKAAGFAPGGGSLHNCMSGHGPDKGSYDKAVKADLKPIRYKDTLAFMFESNKVWHVTDFALNTDLRQNNYIDCWQSLKGQAKF